MTRRNRRKRVRALADHPQADESAPPPEQARHHSYEQVVVAHSAYESPTVLRVTNQRQVDLCRAQKHINEGQWQAADRLYTDYYLGGLVPRVTQDPTAVRGGPRRDFGLTSTMKAIDARARYHEALHGVPGMLRDHLVNVVIKDIPSAESSAMLRGGGGRKASTTGIDRLQIALDILAEHYGI